MPKYSIIKKSILYFLKKYLEFRADITVEKNDTVLIEPPYLVLPNHTNNLDPFLTNIYIDHPIQYLTSDEYFRSFIIRTLLKFVEAIPKRKFVSDTYVIKEIIKGVKKENIIGIFPEGRRNWDGTTEKIIYSTAKLIKLLKIPVIITTLKGTYLSHPRWAVQSRQGKIYISYNLVLKKEQITYMTVNEIYDLIQNEFFYDEYEFQETVMNPYRGKRLAENLEILLFTCPCCSTIGRMVSKENELYCSECNYTVQYNNYGFLENEGDKLFFNNPQEWNQWQLAEIKKMIDKNQLKISDSNIKLIKPDQDRKITDNGSLVITNNKFFFNGKKEIIFFPDKITGLNIQYNNKLEFYYGKELFRFVFDKRVSAYKWLKTLEFLQIAS